MKFGGLMGAITFTGHLGLFMPYLRLAEIINLGQATTFGLGRIAWSLPPLKPGRDMTLELSRVTDRLGRQYEILFYLEAVNKRES